jgi:hypothetical protein
VHTKQIVSVAMRDQKGRARTFGPKCVMLICKTNLVMEMRPLKTTVRHRVVVCVTHLQRNSCLELKYGGQLPTHDTQMTHANTLMLRIPAVMKAILFLRRHVFDHINVMVAEKQQWHFNYAWLAV